MPEKINFNEEKVKEKFIFKCTYCGRIQAENASECWSCGRKSIEKVKHEPPKK
jgi:uncharacterized OB-fold protein